MRRRTVLFVVISLVEGAAVQAPPAKAQGGGSPAVLRRMASNYYNWRNENDPVSSSNQGLHTWDDRLGDFTAEAIAARRRHVSELLVRVKAMSTAAWSRDDRVDWLLFRAQLERAAFRARVLQ